MLGSSGLVGRSLLPVTVRLASFQSQSVDHQQEYMHKGDRHGKFKWGLWHIGGLCPLKGVSDTHLHLIIATWQWQLTLLYGNHVWSPQSWLCLTSQYWMVRNTFKLFWICVYDKLCLTTGTLYSVAHWNYVLFLGRSQAPRFALAGFKEAYMSENK